MASTSPIDPTEAGPIARRFLHLEGPLLPVLHAIQSHYGWVPPETVPIVAEVLNLSRAEVHGVVSFYHDFRSTPPGRHQLKLCQAEACQARGARGITARIEDELGVQLGQTSADGAVSLEPVYCLGLCGTGPAALVDGRPISDLNGRGYSRCLARVRR